LFAVAAGTTDLATLTVAAQHAPPSQQTGQSQTFAQQAQEVQQSVLVAFASQVIVARLRTASEMKLNICLTFVNV
jgi:hypothetical protein